MVLSLIPLTIDQCLLDLFCRICVFWIDLWIPLVLELIRSKLLNWRGDLNTALSLGWVRSPILLLLLMRWTWQVVLRYLILLLWGWWNRIALRLLKLLLLLFTIIYLWDRCLLLLFLHGLIVRCWPRTILRSWVRWMRILHIRLLPILIRHWGWWVVTLGWRVVSLLCWRRRLIVVIIATRSAIVIIIYWRGHHLWLRRHAPVVVDLG